MTLTNQEENFGGFFAAHFIGVHGWEEKHIITVFRSINGLKMKGFVEVL